MSGAVTLQDFPEIRWRGHWIWVPEEPVVPNFALVPTASPDPKEAHGLFRKTIRLDSVPEWVPARMTADSRYVLFANGQEVFRGPIRSQPRRLHYDLFDLAPYLRSGVNILAVHVKYTERRRRTGCPPCPI
jgi:alpha-L-rhamnosidase